MPFMKSLSIFCITVYFGCTLSDSRDGNTKEMLEHLLRIPNPDKVLNSVLGRLERSRQQRLSAGLIDEDCDDPTAVLPEYTEEIYETRDIGLRQIGAQKHYPICHIERNIRRLNTNEYEYRPAYYEEIKCISSFVDVSASNEICSSLGFSCIQWNKTIHLTRRRYSRSNVENDKKFANKDRNSPALLSTIDIDCWETKTMVVPAGCECMWPVHKLGDIKLHI